jgi:predicted secreted hydrolase
MDIGLAGGSYYYSRPNMDLTGTLTLDGGTLEVTGDAWMDHQWGDFVLVDGGGWDWFALQLDNGTSLMLFQLRDVEGIGDPPDFGTLVRPSGEVVHLPEGAYTVEATETWTSDLTSATYPTTYPIGWTIAIPSEEIELNVAASLPDQELDTTASTGTIYWEGEVIVSGMAAGESVDGLGYVELTGYVDDIFSP